MRKTKNFVWIDDRSERKSTADDLGARFIDVRNKDLAKEIQKLLEGRKPDLVILDHVLDKTETKNLLFQRGSTIAEAIKEKWPACPVVGVTNADIERDVDVRTQHTYDALYQFDQLQKYIPRIEGIAADFLVVGKKKVNKPRDLIKLMKPAKDDLDRLAEALPDELKALVQSSKKGKTASSAALLYNWIARLMNRPGFLYDGLWAATVLGINETGFRRVSHLFKKAKYDGVFEREDDPRWWASSILALLYARRPPKPSEMSWQTGRRLPGITHRNFSYCYVCEDEYPETVAYLDPDSKERHAMHLRCTVLDPRYKRELYFEDIRMMLGK